MKELHSGTRLISYMSDNRLENTKRIRRGGGRGSRGTHTCDEALHKTLSHQEWRGPRSTRHGARTTHKWRWLAASEATWGWGVASTWRSKTMRFLDFHTAQRMERTAVLRGPGYIAGRCSASPSTSSARPAAGRRWRAGAVDLNSKHCNFSNNDMLYCRRGDGGLSHGLEITMTRERKRMYA
jgi:hypothetical protein